MFRFFTFIWLIFQYNKGACASVPYQLNKYENTEKLVEAITQSFEKSLNYPRKQILVLDIDETLLKRVSSGGKMLEKQTKLAEFLEKSGIYAISYGVLALTARPARIDVMERTLTTLNKCVPYFYMGMTDSKNFGGKIHEKGIRHGASGYLHKDGLLLMGKTQKTKCETLASFIRENGLDSYEYELFFVDNDWKWFPQFTFWTISKEIKFHHLFYYNFEMVERSNFAKRLLENSHNDNSFKKKNKNKSENPDFIHQIS